QTAAGLRLERPVEYAGRPHRVGVTFELLTAFALLVVPHNEVARHQEHLLPIFVYERLGRVSAGGEPQQARAVAALVLLVELAGDDFFLYAPRVAWPGVPAPAEGP